MAQDNKHFHTNMALQGLIIGDQLYNPNFNRTQTPDFNFLATLTASSKYKTLSNIFKNADNTWTIGLNARHPLARLYSAYSQKFEKVYYVQNLGTYQKYGELMMRLDADDLASSQKPSSRGQTNFNLTTDKHIASFKSFVTLITKFKDLNHLNMHWKPQFTQCNPCGMNFNFISQTETAENDAKYFFGKLFQQQGLDTYGFLPAYGNKVKKYKEKYVQAFGQDWMVHPVMLKIYQMYKLDFISFGYRMDDDF